MALAEGSAAGIPKQMLNACCETAQRAIHLSHLIDIFACQLQSTFIGLLPYSKFTSLSSIRHVYIYGWWFQSLWKILVSWEYSSQSMEKIFQTTNQIYIYIFLGVFHGVWLTLKHRQQTDKTPDPSTWPLPLRRSDSIGIGIPSGKHPKNDGTSPFLNGKPQLFLWPCSITFCMFTRG